MCDATYSLSTSGDMPAGCSHSACTMSAQVMAGPLCGSSLGVPKGGEAPFGGEAPHIGEAPLAGLSHASLPSPDAPRRRRSTVTRPGPSPAESASAAPALLACPFGSPSACCKAGAVPLGAGREALTRP